MLKLNTIVKHGKHGLAMAKINDLDYYIQFSRDNIPIEEMHIQLTKFELKNQICQLEGRFNNVVNNESPVRNLNDHARMTNGMI